MVTRRRHIVARRILFDDLDIGYQARPREGALKQIMTEQRSFRHAIRKRGFECIDVINALAGVRALTV